MDWIVTASVEWGGGLTRMADTGTLTFTVYAESRGAALARAHESLARLSGWEVASLDAEPRATALEDKEPTDE